MSVRKKVMAAVCVIALLFCNGCGAAKPAGEPPAKKPAAQNLSGDCTVGVWISFSEINAMLKSPDGFKSQFDAVLQNCLSVGTKDLYVHVRAYCDSLFPSENFPLIEEARGYDYDVFEYIVSACNSAGIRVHAWINPYRVLGSSGDISYLEESSPARRWLSDDDPANDNNVCLYNGIYLNPAEPAVQQLVIDGIREILTKYAVDGIHFDDYFYPTTDEAFDSVSYEAYRQTADNPLSLSGWRVANVNALISGCYTAVKFMDKDIIFSVSPMASITKNLDELYADVGAWIENGCVDVIIPQLYFGFEYPLAEFTFPGLLKEWKELAKRNGEVALIIGLAPYKIGTDAPNDALEWNLRTDIIARQAQICKEDKRVAGFVLFSYTGTFSDNELNVKQRDNLKNTLNNAY